MLLLVVVRYIYESDAELRLKTVDYSGQKKIFSCSRINMDLKFISSLLLLFCILKLINSEEMLRILPKIGIIGGGIGGTSCAFFLRSLFGEDVSIDLFESEKIGGRLSVVNFDQKLFEEGGSIIHPLNKYMVNFAELFQLKNKKSHDGSFGLFNGEEFVFSESNWKIITAFNMLYRYGFGYFKLERHINDWLNKFVKIYTLQEEGLTFDNVTSLLAALDSDFVDSLTTDTKKKFLQEGIPEIVVDEIIMATIRANYGQNLKIHKMVGSVSVAGAGGDLWAIHGGNNQVPQNLLKVSKARFINKLVTAVTKLENGKFLLHVKERSDIPIEDDNYLYDVVIVAAPQTSDMKNKLTFHNLTEPVYFPGKYHRTVCTLIKGTLRGNFFGDKNSVIDEIFTTNDKIIFNSIGRISPVDFSPETHNKSNVWKIFSQRLLTDLELLTLFSEVKDKYVKDWLAYPHYDTNPRLDSFVLDKNLYYVNAIEWAASAMEMSVIGGRNVALLTVKNWKGDSVKLKKTVRDEL